MRVFARLLGRVEAHRRFAAFAAFVFPVLIRSVPEVIAWPYPLGFDTLIYADWVLDGYISKLSVQSFFHYTNLFALLAALSHQVSGLDVLLLMKVLGPILYGFLGLALYFFGRRVLGWKVWKSLFVVFIVSVYFVSLRISWEMYKQMLGTILMLAAIIAYKSDGDARFRYLSTGVLSILTVMSHELPSVILLSYMIIEFIRMMYRRGFNRARLLVFSEVSAGLLFLYQRYNFSSGTIDTRVQYVASVSSLQLASYVLGFVSYCYVFLIPMVIVGAFSLREHFTLTWTGLGLFFSLSPLVMPAAAIILWFRWAIFLVYPLCFFFVEGFERLVSMKRRRIVSTGLKAFSLVLVVVIAVLSGYYLTTYPENAYPYFSNNSYLAYIQSSMLQNSISLKDTQATVELIKWLDVNFDNKSMLVVHEAFYNWAVIYFNHKDSLVLVQEQSLQSPSRQTTLELIESASINSVDEGYNVYTIWWRNGKGWYEIPQLPSDFIEAKASGDMALYLYIK